MPSLIIPSIAAYHDGKCEWRKGDINGAHTFQLSQHTAAIANAVLVEEIKLLKDDESKTVAKACEGIQSIIELCGPTVVVPVLQELLTATHELLIKVAPCQSSEGQLYDGAELDDEDHDTTTQAACDMIGAYMRVLGPSLFGQYLVQFLPPIVDYCKTSRPPADRAMAIGCLGEIAQECNNNEAGVSIMEQNWSSAFLPCILATIGDSENDNVQRNAAFCIGVCVEAMKDRIPIQDCQTLLQGLGPLLYRNKNSGPNSLPPGDSAMACVDNAIAAVARMIMYGPAGAIPLGQVLPVLLAALPLETDFTENDTVYNCLLGLLNMAHTNSDVQANAPNIQRILMAVCQNDGDGELDEELQNKIKSALQSLNAQ
jgi:importin-4